MNKLNFKYIYGPVSSWRLGSSLGIDLFSQNNKVCNFNCIYCQIGENPSYTLERKVYVETRDIIKELKILPSVKIDYITLSGSGEPTLASNLGKTIKAIKDIRREPIAVLTNSSFIDRSDVRIELALADFVSVKLDAWDQESLEKINKPAPKIKFNNILKGIIQFRKEYSKKLALQIMFINENKNHAKNIAELAQEIKPDEIQINTPLRTCLAEPLSENTINKIKEHFKKLNVVTVYDVENKNVTPINPEDTQKRRRKLYPDTN